MKIKQLTKTAIIPTRNSEKAAGYDLYADRVVNQHSDTTPSDINDTIVIPPHSTTMISTGIAIAIPDGYFGAIFARSGISTKRGLRPANCTGVIDSDYRGDIIVALHNDSDEPQVVEPHERIAQLVIISYQSVEFEVVYELDETERGENGFGSSGTH